MQRMNVIFHIENGFEHPCHIGRMAQSFEESYTQLRAILNNDLDTTTRELQSIETELQCAIQVYEGYKKLSGDYSSLLAILSVSVSSLTQSLVDEKRWTKCVNDEIAFLEAQKSLRDAQMNFVIENTPDRKSAVDDAEKLLAQIVSDANHTSNCKCHMCNPFGRLSEDR